MMETIRKHLLMWLNVPSPREPEVDHQDLKALMDRMDSLERMVMTKLQRPDERSDVISESVGQNLSELPDAHLGAQ